MENMEVDLRPHVGQVDNAEIGVQQIQHDQYLIIVSSDSMRAKGRKAMHVGYVGVQPGRPLNMLPQINQFGTGVAERIHVAVCATLLDAAKQACEQLKLEGAPDSHVQAAKENAEREASLKRKLCLPPSDRVMSAPLPDSVPVASEDTDADDDEVDAFDD